MTFIEITFHTLPGQIIMRNHHKVHHEFNFTDKIGFVGVMLENTTGVYFKPVTTHHTRIDIDPSVDKVKYYNTEEMLQYRFDLLL